MTHNLKALGVAIGAVFAIGAVTASAASATDLITTSKSPAVITAANTATPVLKITKADGIGAIAETKCATTKYSGTVTSSGAKEITVFPTAFGTKAEPNNPSCETSLGTAKVEFNSCDYDLTGETTKEDLKDKTGKKDAVVSITCKTVGDEIKVVAPASCTISIPAQTPTEGGVVYTNGEELALIVQQAPKG